MPLTLQLRLSALYDSFVNLTDDLQKIGRQLGTVQGSYDTAIKKLTNKGNLVNRVEKLKKLGAKASKQLDQKLLTRAQNSSDSYEIDDAE
ncbi:DNA recombination protein RmuC [Antarcticibacterium sp. 1MA-6-2]|uniref:DNA recombination protein RmuC n=1 Tax=Antarcticibacterium sp. 1MA-6-2 TaxID=2908210 RepID=UPI0028833605|nr:DNA recombination protein RmuC [Antarcticibacterium sp. 1MA-6-2]